MTPRKTQSTMRVLGLMSGTSADGIDVALAHISPPRGSSGTPRPVLERFAFVPYPAAVRSAILRLANGEASTAGEVSNLNFTLGEMFARAVIQACRRFHLPLSKVDLIGSHGQTIYHQGHPAPFLARSVASTLQIGEPSVIVERTGIPTVADFRTADLAAGGQGAPLVPFVDYLLYRLPGIPRIALNIGGIANVTVLPAGARSSQVLAFDTGPGNMIVDALMHHFTGGRRLLDKDARFAQRGRLLPGLLTELMRHSYFRKKPPKSAGREQFGLIFTRTLVSWARRNRARPEDVVRTATLLTPLSILDALHRWVWPLLGISVARRRHRGMQRPRPQLIIAGGGAHNPLMRAQLEAGLGGVELLSSHDLGVPEDAKEALAFAILAYETFHGRPSNLPSATGARHAAVLGKICLPCR